MEKKKIIVPLITPFKADQTIDHHAIKPLVRHVLDKGADGIYAVGSSAEFIYLSVEERKALLESCIRAADGAYVIAHVSNNSTDSTLDLARHAERAGADALSSIPPNFFTYSERESKQYYYRLADATALPVMIYNYPKSTNVQYSLTQFIDILRHDKITAIKYTDTDYYMMERIKTATGKIIYSGRDECCLSALSQGADGAIGTTFNFMAELFVEIVRLYVFGDTQHALQAQQRANSIIEKATAENCIQATRYILSLQGIETGLCREPILPLSEKIKAEIKAVYEKNFTL